MTPGLCDKLVVRSFRLFNNPQSDKLHFSFIIHRNKIIADGWNFRKKTHSLANRFGYLGDCIHSELHAITRLPFKIDYLRKCSIVNIRLGKDKRVLLSRPCKICQKVISAFGIGETWYSNEYGKFEQLIY